jgi:hypothetical protein
MTLSYNTSDERRRINHRPEDFGAYSDSAHCLRNLLPVIVRYGGDAQSLVYSRQLIALGGRSR